MTLNGQTWQISSQPIKTLEVQTKDMAILTYFGGKEEVAIVIQVGDSIVYGRFSKTQLGHRTKNGTGNSERVARTFYHDDALLEITFRYLSNRRQ